MYDSRSYERYLVVVAVARAKPEKFAPKWDPNHHLCDAGAVLYKLSKQANWPKLVFMWVDHFNQWLYLNISDLFYSSLLYSTYTL